MNSNFSRRDFVKTSAAAVGGISIASLPIETYANSSVDDTLKVALIGCGGRGTGAALQALTVKQNVKLVAMADAFRDRIDSCYQNLTTEKVPGKGVKSRVDVPEERKFVGFDGYKQAIALADVVILTTPPGFRPIHFEEAVRQGKHIFMEKPVATDAPGIRRVLAAAEEAKKKNLKIVVGLQRHYQKSYIETYKKVIDEGVIGDIVAARCYWNNDGVWKVSPFY